MGCEVLAAGASAAEAARIRALFEEREATFSRFRPDTELRRVNAAAGGAVTVSALFRRTLDTALWAAQATGGLVDPTVGAAVEAAGYGRDFEALSPDPRPPGPAAPARPAGVRVVGPLVFLAAGVQLDLNGVVKAEAVDDGLELLSGPGFVSAGGDLATRGEVDVAVPGGESVRLVSGGLATSGRNRRRWVRDGEEQHHLIDPVSGRPAGGPWEQVTACGSSCLVADVAAKAAYLLGDDGPDWLDERGLPGRFLRDDGSVHENGCWRASLRRETACI